MGLQMLSFMGVLFVIEPRRARMMKVGGGRGGGLPALPVPPCLPQTMHGRCVSEGAARAARTGAHRHASAPACLCTCMPPACMPLLLHATRPQAHMSETMEAHESSMQAHMDAQMEAHFAQVQATLSEAECSNEQAGSSPCVHWRACMQALHSALVSGRVCVCACVHVYVCVQVLECGVRPLCCMQKKLPPTAICTSLSSADLPHIVCAGKAINSG